MEEACRLKRLQEYRVLDTEPETALDDLAALAAQICGTPISAVSLVDAKRQWFKAQFGLNEKEMPREVSFCAHALHQREMLIVPDAATDSRFATNPLVTGEPGMRFYAGAPLVTQDGAVLGTLCVIDRVPRELEPPQKRALEVLARQVMTHLELHREIVERGESGRLLHTIFDSDPDCLKLLSEDGRVQMINAAGLRIIEAENLEEIPANGMFSLVVEEHRDAFACLTRRVFAGEEGLLEHDLVGLKGTRRHLEIHAAPLRNESGAVIALLGITRDITERWRAEETVRASELRYRTLFEHALDGILIADATGMYIDANPAICRMLALKREELIGLRAADISAESESHRAEPAIQKLRQHLDYHGVWQFKRKDGSIFPVEISATMTPEGNLLAVVRDITARMRAESRMRRLVDSNAQGVFFWNKEGWIMEANDAFLSGVGYSRSDLEAGRIHWRELTPPEYFERDSHCHAELSTTGICAPYEKELIRKDGSRVPVLVGTALFDDDSEEGVSFILDLTERKRLEQQFLRNQRMESIGTLAGGIAHDLNNMLGPIITSIELLEMQFPDPKSQELLEIIGSSARRGAEMVQQVLSFARGMEGRRMEVQVKHLIAEIGQIVGDTFLKHIQVRKIVPSNLWTILGDPTQLHQVLLNLCVNARDAMLDGGTLTLSAENVELDAHYAAMNSEAHPGRYIMLKVEDSGAGIRPEIVDRIFDPFFTTKETGKGTGLGLSTSLGIVKGHGGFIRVESKVGRGATFKVFLPVSPEVLSAAAVEVVPKLPRGHGELILLVDDEERIRLITKGTLEANGYSVVSASDGTEAVTALAIAGAKIAAVLTDMTMPVMDGRATIRALRKMSPGLPIAATSGLPEDSRLEGLGVTHFLPKPYSAQALLEMLERLLAKA